MGKEIYSLHFYPDGHMLKVHDATGNVVESFPAKGGDPSLAGSGGFEATKKGTFFVGEIKAHGYSGSQWAMSKVTWGATVWLRLSDYQVFDYTGKLLPRVILSKNDITNAYRHRPDLLDKIFKSMEARVAIPYYFNDFGHTSIKVFEDKNGNGRLDWGRGETIHNQFLHTEPKNEWEKMQGQAYSPLEYSHGCIHLYPSDIDTLIQKYVVPFKTTLTVH